MDILDLFPTPLGIFDLGRDFTDNEMSFVQSQEKINNTYNLRTLDSWILERADLKAIRTFIQRSVDEYFAKVYAPKQDTHLKITQSWCNYTDPGQHHHKHAHPNSFLSGVLYLQADNESDRIYFYKDVWHQLQTPADQYNMYNSASWWMPAYPGRLYVFPSHLAHMVETVNGVNTRMSLSFNTFPVGDFGDTEYLAGLNLPNQKTSHRSLRRSRTNSAKDH